MSAPIPHVMDGHDGGLLVIAMAAEIIASDIPTPGLDTLERCERLADAGYLDRSAVQSGYHYYAITERGLELVRGGLLVR